MSTGVIAINAIMIVLGSALGAHSYAIGVTFADGFSCGLGVAIALQNFFDIFRELKKGQAA